MREVIIIFNFIFSQVLFLGCNDLRKPLTTAIGTRHIPNLHIHVNDSSMTIIARNILLTNIISSLDFNPDNEGDMAYIWDIWYNATWPESTLKRFLNDVENLLNEPLPANIIISDSQHLEALQSVWTEWLTFIHSSSIEDILAQR